MPGLPNVRDLDCDCKPLRKVDVIGLDSGPHESERGEVVEIGCHPTRSCRPLAVLFATIKANFSYFNKGSSLSKPYGT